MDVEPAALGEQRLGDDQAVRADDRRRRVELEARLEPLRLQDGDAEPLGASLAGGGGEPAARPRRGASGRGQEARERRAARRAVRARRRRRAPSPRRRCAPWRLPREDEPRPEDAESLPPRLLIGPVDDQLPVEMVELVLDDARREPFERERDGVAGSVPALDGHLHGALDVDADGAEGEAPFLVDLDRLARSVSTGLTSTWSSPSSWNTNTRRRTPTCVAASPTPAASCMSAIIRSVTRRSSSSNSVTSPRACAAPGRRTAGSARAPACVGPPARRPRAPPRRRARRPRRACSWSSWSWSCAISAASVTAVPEGARPRVRWAVGRPASGACAPRAGRRRRAGRSGRRSSSGRRGRSRRSPSPSRSAPRA